MQERNVPQAQEQAMIKFKQINQAKNKDKFIRNL